MNKLGLIFLVLMVFSYIGIIGLIEKNRVHNHYDYVIKEIQNQTGETEVRVVGNKCSEECNVFVGEDSYKVYVLSDKKSKEIKLVKQ